MWILSPPLHIKISVLCAKYESVCDLTKWKAHSWHDTEDGEQIKDERDE